MRATATETGRGLLNSKSLGKHAVTRNTILLSAGMAALYGMNQLAVAVATTTFAFVSGRDGLAGIGPAIFLATAAFAAFAAGRAMDHLGRVPVLAVGFGLGILGCALRDRPRVELLLRRCHGRVVRRDGLGRAGKDPGIRRLALGPSWREFGFVGRLDPGDDRTSRALRGRAGLGRGSSVLDPAHDTKSERLVAAMRDNDGVSPCYKPGYEEPSRSPYGIESDGFTRTAMFLSIPQKATSRHLANSANPSFSRSSSRYVPGLRSLRALDRLEEHFVIIL
jgi:hypothetical protein